MPEVSATAAVHNLRANRIDSVVAALRTHQRAGGSMDTQSLRRVAQDAFGLEMGWVEQVRLADDRAEVFVIFAGGLHCSFPVRFEAVSLTAG